MKKYQPDQLRNVVLLSHSGAGKTSLSEAMIYNTGATSRLGKVDEGTTVSDFDDEEKNRQLSINTSVVPCAWKDHKINVLDTPGYADFVGEVISATRVAEAAIVVIDATAGVEVGTELMWKQVEEKKLPRLVFINKMDRDNADFQNSLEQIQEAFDYHFVPLQVPIGRAEDFEGTVDILAQEARLGSNGQKGEIPSELEGNVSAYREQLVEAAVETDDELIMKYLEGEDLTGEEVREGLHTGIKQGNVIPVLCGSALNNVGIEPLMDAVLAYLPSPTEDSEIRATNPATGEDEILEPEPGAPLSALVFKTVADPYVGKLSYFRVYSGALESDARAFNSRSGEEERLGQLYVLQGGEQVAVDRINVGDIGGVAKLQETRTGDTLCDKGHPLILPTIEFPNPVYSVAISPKTQADMDKMGSALSRIVEQDPTLRVERQSDTGETLLSGMGESHINIATSRLKEKFGVDIETSVPQVPYKETIRAQANAQGRYKKQSGGRGQYGDVFVRLEPLSRSSGFEFDEEIFGGAVPRQYIPAVEKGIREAKEKGYLAGYPVVDFRAVLYDGSYHSVDSSEMAFKIAASMGFKNAMEHAAPVLLEPIMDVTVTVPNEFMGDVLGDLNTKRAQVQGMDQRGGLAVIRARAPLAEMQRYATDLRSITQGRGIYTMEFSHYEDVPNHIAEDIIKRARREAEEEG